MRKEVWESVATASALGADARPAFPRVQDLLRVQDWLLPAAVPVP